MAQLLSRWTSIALFVSILVCPAMAFGQSPSSEELLAIIKKLEARIAELEAKTAKPVGSVAETKSATQASEATMTELKKDIEISRKKIRKMRPSSISSKRLKSPAMSMDTMDTT